MKDMTTIPLQKSTRLRLMQLGRKSDTYDDLVLKLLDHYQN